MYLDRFAGRPRTHSPPSSQMMVGSCLIIALLLEIARFTIPVGVKSQEVLFVPHSVDRYRLEEHFNWVSITAFGCSMIAQVHRISA